MWMALGLVLENRRGKRKRTNANVNVNVVHNTTLGNNVNVNVVSQKAQVLNSLIYVFCMFHALDIGNTFGHCLCHSIENISSFLYNLFCLFLINPKRYDGKRGINSGSRYHE